MKKTVIVIMAVALMAGRAWAGYQFTITSVSEGAAKGRQAQGQKDHNTVVMSADAEKARIVFKEGQGPGTGEGGYLITKDAGKTFYLVSPKDKTYMKWDMDSMMGMVGAMGGMMKMEVSDPKIEKQLDEAGESILGYPTRHYKFRTTYHMSMTVMGFKNETDTIKDEETWTTTELDITTLGAWVNKTPKTQNPDFDKLVRAEMSKMSGMPLRTLSLQTAIDSQGKTNVTRSAMNVTEIKKIGADEISVEIPADYKEINLFQPADEDTSADSAPKKQKPMPAMDFNSMMKKAMESAE